MDCLTERVKRNGYTVCGGNSLKQFCLPSEKGSKCFRFRVDPFSDVHLYAGKHTGNHKSCLSYKKKWQKIYQKYPVPFKLSTLGKIFSRL